MYSLVFWSDLQQFELKDDFCLAPPPSNHFRWYQQLRNFVFHCTHCTSWSHRSEERKMGNGVPQTQPGTHHTLFPNSCGTGRNLLWLFGWYFVNLSRAQEVQKGNSMSVAQNVCGVSQPEAKGVTDAPSNHPLREGLFSLWPALPCRF